MAGKEVLAEVVDHIFGLGRVDLNINCYQLMIFYQIMYLCVIRSGWMS